MTKNTAPLVIYFDRRKVDVYIGDQDKTVSWQMPSTIFHHLEIQDGRAFRKLFEDVIFANKIKPTKIIIIFSQNIVFAIDLPDGAVEPEKREKLLAQFKEQVPFASPFVKEVKLDKKDMAIALNRDVFELMVTQLKGLGFDVTTLVTSHIVPFNIPTTGMTKELAQNCIKEWARLELHDFLEPEQKKSLLVSRDQQDPKDKNRIFMYLGVFAVLVLIFGGVLVGYFQQSARDKAAVEAARAQLQKQAEEAQLVNFQNTAESSEDSNSQSQPNPELQVQVADDLVTPPTTEELEERAEYSVIVFEPQSSTLKASELVAKLKLAGFVTIETRSVTTEISNSLVITTDEDVSAKTRQMLKPLLSEFDNQISVKSVSGSEANIVVILPN